MYLSENLEKLSMIKDGKKKHILRAAFMSSVTVTLVFLIYMYMSFW